LLSYFISVCLFFFVSFSNSSKNDVYHFLFAVAASPPRGQTPVVTADLTRIVTNGGSVASTFRMDHNGTQPSHGILTDNDTIVLKSQIDITSTNKPCVVAIRNHSGPAKESSDEDESSQLVRRSMTYTFISFFIQLPICSFNQTCFFLFDRRKVR